MAITLASHTFDGYADIAKQPGQFAMGGYQSGIEVLSLPDPPRRISFINDEIAFRYATRSSSLEIGHVLTVDTALIMLRST